jgi:hypothetical protein
VPLGERHLRRALAEYVTHYHRERNHQGLGNELIDRPSVQRTRGLSAGASEWADSRVLLPVSRVAVSVVRVLGQYGTRVADSPQSPAELAAFGSKGPVSSANIHAATASRW